MLEGEAGVGGAEPGEGAALVWMEETFGFRNGRLSDCHHSFEDLGDGFEEDHETKGSRGVVGVLGRLVEDYAIGGL